MSFPASGKHERILWFSLVGFLLTIILFLTVIIIRNDMSFITARPINRPSTYQKARQFEKIYNYIVTHAVNADHLDELFQAAIDGMLEQLDDPHAVFVSGDAARAMQSRLNGHFRGIGTVIIKHPADGFWLDERERYVHVVEVHSGSPAARGGLQVNDFITEINGDSTEPMDASEVVLRLRGPVDSPVQLTVLREDEILMVELKRDYIQVATVRREMMDSIGYLQLHQFAHTTADDVKKALAYFEAQGAEGVVIDVRGNPGGSLEAVVKIADFFLAEGVIVSTQSRSSLQNHVFKASKKGSWGEHVPLVVLMDSESASASEVLAGALQDHQRATIMGQASYGKASVQQLYPLNRAGDELLKLTIAYYFTPSGQNIDRHGITPDIITELLVPPPHSEETHEAIRELYRRRVFEQFLSSTPRPTPSERDTFAAKQLILNEMLDLPLLLWHFDWYLSMRIVREEGYDLDRDALLLQAKSYLLLEDTL